MMHTHSHTHSVLSHAQESHLKELGCANVGDRIIFLEFLKLLKKHKRDADRSKSLWNATTPVCSLAYHRNCGSFCFQVTFNNIHEFNSGRQSA